MNRGEVLTQQERELLAMFRKLDTRDQAQIVTHVQEWVLLYASRKKGGKA